MTLAREYRIKGEKVIEEIKKEGKLIQSTNFGVCVKKNKDGEKTSPRFSFIVSKKISKLAVHRNRIKRALSEAVRQNLVLVPKGYDFVFLTKKELEKKTTDEIKREVETFLRGLKI